MSERQEIEERLRRALRWMADHPAPVSRTWRDVTSRASSARPSSDGAVDEALSAVGEDEEGLWLDEPGGARARRRRSVRPVLAVVAVAACVVALAVPLGLVLTGGSGSGTGTGGGRHTQASDAHQARSQVLSALSTTTAAGNFSMQYQLSETAGSAAATTTTTTTPPCVGSPPAPVSGVAHTMPKISHCVVVTPAQPQNVTVSGSGVINVDPKAMVVQANINTFGTVAVRLNDTTVWEESSNDTGLAPLPIASTGVSIGPVVGPDIPPRSSPDVPSTDGGTPLSEFAGLTEGTLGQREGAVGMMGMASPTGYLDVDESSVSTAAATGTGTVDGTAVTFYRVTVDPSALAQAPGITTEEVTTIQNALQVLTAQGYTTTTDVLAVDAQGFVVQSTSTTAFSDGGTVVLQANFSNFGCSGTVLMPGQTGPTGPPANCVSPDSTLPGTMSTTTVPTSTTTSTTSPTTPKVGGGGKETPTTSTTVPATTTTAPNPGSTTTSTAPAQNSLTPGWHSRVGTGAGTSQSATGSGTGTG